MQAPKFLCNRTRSSRTGWRRLAVVILSTLLLVGQTERAQAVLVWQLNLVDIAGDVGDNTSLVLDAAGHPVISYYDNTNGDLKLAHCNDTNCSGNDESIQAVDSLGDVGDDTSLVLDAAGHPVISYYDITNGDLKLAHCNDANCSGNDENIQTVDNSGDSAGDVGNDTSLVLDAAGQPVISYADDGNGNLKLVHCNDANCSGNDESIQTVDSTGDDTSLALDAAGQPVISYHDAINGALKLVHCNDVNCSGNDENIQTVDSAGDVGRYTSLVLDATGQPVISYRDNDNEDLKLVHCNDVNCSGNDEHIQTVDSGGAVGRYTSLALDAAGQPAISYFDTTNSALKLVHCNDANCSGNDEKIETVDDNGAIGYDTSLVLDGFGQPVISYYDLDSGALKLAHYEDDLPPSAAINQAFGQADPATSSPIHFTADFSEPVTDFTNTDLSFTGSTTEGTLHVVVTGGPKTYDIAVSGMLGSGTLLITIPANVATDNTGNGNSASISSDNSVSYTVVNQAPVAISQTVTTTKATPVNLTLSASDVDNQPLTYQLVSTPTHGSLGGTLPTLSYTPTIDFNGRDQFTFQASDGIATSAVATVTVVVQAANDTRVIFLPLVKQ